MEGERQRLESEASFGARLRSLREAAGVTQEEMTFRAGLSPNAVSALERGTRRRPHLDTLRSLSEAPGLSEDEQAGLLAAIPKRPLTLMGTGGVGRTRLALAASREAAGLFADRVTVVALASPSAPGLVLPMVVQGLPRTDFFALEEPTSEH